MADIRPGDLVIGKHEDGGVWEARIADLAPRGETVPGRANLLDLCRPRFRTEAGELFNIGALSRVIVFRWGTHHTLAGSVR